MADQVRINGNLYSWSSVKFLIDGDPYTGITSITYADKRERAYGYGMGRHHAPHGRSAGKYTPDPVKVTMWRGAAQAARTALAALALDQISYGNVRFVASVQYIEIGEVPINVTIEGCVWTANSATDEESPDPLKEEVELNPMLIRRNGLVLFDSTEGSP